MAFRLFRFLFGVIFIVLGLIISIFGLRWGYGFLASSLIAEILSAIGDEGTKKKFEANQVSEKKERLHHWHFGLLLIIISLFILQWDHFDVFFGFALSMFLHDALYHLCVKMFDIDKNWRKLYKKPSDSNPQIDHRIFFY